MPEIKPSRKATSKPALNGSVARNAARRRASRVPIQTRRIRAVEAPKRRISVKDLSHRAQPIDLRQMKRDVTKRKAHRFDSVDIMVSTSLAINIVLVVWVATLLWR